ncbi:MAG: hypothetical protein KAQ96_03935, partial [Thermoplasmata archaeon]|nr:hypothetical protein [Thermoplasmata archaeon]
VSATHPGPPDAVDPVPLTEAAELTVTQRYEVVGVETYDRVRVAMMGTLVIPNGASLVSTTVVLEGASRLEMTGGSLLLRGKGGFPPSLSGSCQHIDLSKGSSIRVWGGNGTADHEDATMGAPATMDILSMTYITISDSIVEVLGGHGLSPDAPLTSEDLMGDECSGGDAALALIAKDLDNAVSIRSSVIRVQAGSGGDAPHGLPQAGSGGQRGGGYSMGGLMGGHVGEGGSTSFSLSAMTVFIDTSTITLSGGDGGDAGNGGKVPTGSETGGGGGGYSGGSGSAGIGSAKAGGRVRGDVGSGGDVTYRVTGDDYVQISTRIDLQAGNGGDAGKGGGSSGDGGGGGGGYSGGGGGSEMEPRGAAGGLVGGRVASGGDVQAILLLDEDVRMVEATLDMRAGDGGQAGDGGLSTGDAGGGGGGYSAGGGAGSVSEAGITGKSMYGGPGSPVEDQVASGGDAVLRINSSTGYLQWSEVRSKAGDGGRGGKAGRTWQDPTTDYWMGGGGGGAYSAGGGGGYGEYSSDPRGGGEGAFALGEVGDGGDSSLRLEIVTPTIHRQNNITSSRGEGGLCWRSTAAGSTGGEGGGRFTRDGRAHTYVP